MWCVCVRIYMEIKREKIKRIRTTAVIQSKLKKKNVWGRPALHGDGGSWGAHVLRPFCYKTRVA